MTGGQVTPEAIQAYLRLHNAPDAELVHVGALGDDAALGLKSYGYGRPLHIIWEVPGTPRVRMAGVLHTLRPDAHGHDRRADRIAALAEAMVDFASVPQHVRALDVGTLDPAGAMVSLQLGEPWLLTEYVAGEPYARSLAEAVTHDRAPADDLRRAEALADYLAMLHLQPRLPEDHHRHVRDTIGSGEGIFGIADEWPHGNKVASAERLCRIEQAAVAWRWQLRGQGHRARRIHGDFHPFNIIFRAGEDFSVIDCSRRGAGDPVDDVTCLALNFLFFALRAHGRFVGAGRELWDAFWDRYLVASRDHELLRFVAPWFAWRVLVVASPVWYPDVEDEVRETLLAFAERLLRGATFDPFEVEALL